MLNFFLLILIYCVYGCSSLTQDRTRDLSSLDGENIESTTIKENCRTLLGEVFTLNEEEVIERAYKERIKKFWKYTHQNNLFNLTWFDRYELWSTDLLMRWNKNPEHSFFLDDPQKSFIIINSIKKHFYGKESTMMVYKEALTKMEAILNRYSKFVEYYNELVKKHEILKYQRKTLERLGKKAKYPFTIKMYTWKHRQMTRDYPRTFSDDRSVNRYLTKLDIQSSLLQTRYLHKGKINDLQQRQAADYERLFRLKDALVNVYNHQQKEGAVDDKLKNLLTQINNLLNNKSLMPHRSFRRKIIIIAKVKEWKEFRIFITSFAQKNEALKNLKNFIDSFSEAQLEEMGLKNKKERWDKSVAIVRRNQIVAGITALFTTGGGLSTFIALKDTLFDKSFEEEKACITLPVDATDQYIQCADDFFESLYGVKEAHLYYITGNYSKLKKGDFLNNKFITKSKWMQNKRSEYKRLVKAQRSNISK